MSTRKVSLLAMLLWLSGALVGCSASDWLSGLSADIAEAVILDLLEPLSRLIGVAVGSV